MQTFYADEMQRHGYGRRTFGVHDEVEHITALHPTAFSAQPENKWKITTEMKERLGDVGEMPGLEIRLFFVGILPNSCGGRGAQANYEGEGRAFVCDKPEKYYQDNPALQTGVLWDVKTVAHELGHVFGLRDNYASDAPDIPLMETSNVRLEITATAAAKLSQHPAFIE